MRTQRERKRTTTSVNSMQEKQRGRKLAVDRGMSFNRGADNYTTREKDLRPRFRRNIRIEAPCQAQASHPTVTQVNRKATSHLTATKSNPYNHLNLFGANPISLEPRAISLYHRIISSLFLYIYPKTLSSLSKFHP